MVASPQLPARRMFAMESPRAQLALLLLCVAAECAYIASFSPFPSVDSAAHLGSAWMMADQLRGGAFAAMMRWHFAPLPPNTLPSLVWVGLGELCGYQRAETMLFCGYAIGLALASWWALRQLRNGAEALAFFALPCTFSFSLLYGFLNFSWSLVVLLLFAGVSLREREATPSRRGLVLRFALLVALYGTHFVGWLIGALWLTCDALVRAARDRTRAARILLASASTVAPTALLAAWFLLQTRSGAAGTMIAPLTKALKIMSLEYGLLAYQRWERAAFLALAAWFWTLQLRAARREGRARWREPRVLALLGTITFAVALAIFGPEGTSSGAVFLAPRLAAIATLLGVLIAGIFGITRGERLVTCALCIACATWLAVVREPALRAVERGQRALLALAPHIEPHRTVVQANLAWPRFGDTGRLDPLTAETGRLVPARGLLDLGNVDLALPYFVLRIQPALNPWTWMVLDDHNIEDSPPPLDLRGYTQKTGLRVDYVVLLGRSLADAEQLASPSWRAFEAQLTRDFALRTTTGDGLWELWRAR